MKVCIYGCGQEAKHQLKNGKWCCSENPNSCLGMRKKFSNAKKEEHTKKYMEKEQRKKKRKEVVLTLKKLKEK